MQKCYWTTYILQVIRIFQPIFFPSITARSLNIQTVLTRVISGYGQKSNIIIYIFSLVKVIN